MIDADAYEHTLKNVENFLNGMKGYIIAHYTQQLKEMLSNKIANKVFDHDCTTDHLTYHAVHFFKIPEELYEDKNIDKLLKSFIDANNKSKYPFLLTDAYSDPRLKLIGMTIDKAIKQACYLAELHTFYYTLNYKAHPEWYYVFYAPYCDEKFTVEDILKNPTCNMSDVQIRFYTDFPHGLNKKALN